MRKFTITIVLSLSFLFSFADDGMWIPSLLGKYNIKDMQAKGLKLSAEDIYSINQGSLKDAVVLFGGGCTGAVVSDQGLLLTNHHCGYGSIQAHSSIEHDYLTNGFWAMSQEEELPNPGLTVTFLVRMDDVTDKIMEALKPGMTEAERTKAIGTASDAIIAEATKDTRYQAQVKPLFSGNQYFLYILDIYKDVRLVGAPPSAIGKFGGDTDNWMWPRHTGDFSIFRIYADTNNNPAEYSKNNVPFKPGRHMDISLKGIQKDDFTFVYGYPASTEEYIPSFMVSLISDVIDPLRISIRQTKLDIIGAAMNEDPLVRIQYASKDAGIANGWKKWIGEVKGLRRLDAIQVKEQFEKEFERWTEDLGRKEYIPLLPAYEKLVTDLEPVQYWVNNFAEAIWSMDIVRYAAAYRNLAKMENPTDEELAKEVDRLKKGAEGFFKNYNQAVDRKVFSAMLEIFRKNIKPDQRPGVYKLIDTKFHGDINAYTDWVYEKSFLVSNNSVNDFLDKYKYSHRKKLMKDPVYALMQGFLDFYKTRYAAKIGQLQVSQDSLQRIYMKGIMEMEQGKLLYPDANFTLRVSYGKVEDYYPRDAVHYDYQTKLKGVIEKDDPSIYDYVVPQKLKDLYRDKDYGPYGLDGTMNVCFIATNHTSGGNSGSPVMNAEGQLIGLNFDRNWEGTMSDIMYDPSVCRNITLDIRYCLFIIDKFAGDKRLVDEMTLVR